MFINICIDIIFDSLSQLCRGHNAIMETGVRFVNVIKELLQRLLEYRKIIQNEIKEHRMSCIVNLLVSFFFIMIRLILVRLFTKKNKQTEIPILDIK